MLPERDRTCFLSLISKPLVCNIYLRLTCAELIWRHLADIFLIPSLFLQFKSLVLAALVASASAFVPSRPVVARSATSLQMADSVEERVRELVKSQLNPDGDFEDSANFMEDLGADSLDAVELIMSLEEEFNVEIPDDEVEGITTVQAAIDYVKSKQ